MRTETLVKRPSQLSVSDFIKINPYEINRSTQRRLKKVEGYIKMGLDTIFEVKVGIVVKPFSNYNVGDLVCLDGNARADVWRMNKDLRPDRKLSVTYYELSDKILADALYYTIDSASSAETAADKITGLFREKGYEPQSPKLQKGAFKSTLDVACRFGTNDEGVYLNTSSERTKLDFFWDETIYLDKHKDIFEHKKTSMNVQACLLMVGKKYGVKNPRFKMLVDNFTKEVTVINNSKEVDGVTYVFSSLYSEKKEIWKNNGYNSYQKGLNDLLPKILHSFDSFMKNENIQKFGKSSLTSHFDYWKFYQFYNQRIKN